MRVLAPAVGTPVEYVPDVNGSARFKGCVVAVVSPMKVDITYYTQSGGVGARSNLRYWNGHGVKPKSYCGPVSA